MEWILYSAGNLARVNYQGNILDGDTSANMALGYYEKSSANDSDDSPPQYDATNWACDNFAIFCKTGNPNAYSSQSHQITADLIKRCGKSFMDLVTLMLQGPEGKNANRARNAGKRV
jgi:hypothetical protein